MTNNGEDNDCDPTRSDPTDHPARISRRRLGAVTALAGAAGAAASACSGAASPGGPAQPPPGPLGLALNHEQFRTPDLVSFAEHGEQSGFGHIWFSDHLQPWQDNQGHSMSPWLTLALASERLRHASFGTGVTCPLHRHPPAEVAQTFASLELLAPGRVFLGVGTGEAVNEQAGTGQYGRYRERHDRLVEAVQLIRQLWTGQRVTFNGRYYKTDQLKLYDVPPTPPPIMVAASGPKSARLAGEHGDGWITQSGQATDPKLRGAFTDGARAAGRDPRTMPIWAETFAVVGDRGEVDRAAELWRFTAAGSDQPNPVDIQRRAEQNAPLEAVSAKWPKGTDPAAHADALRPLLDAGITPFMHFPQQDPHAAITFYRDRVLPRLR